jgi:acylphosphatase
MSGADPVDERDAAARLVARGRVQGVGFRWFTRSVASALGLAGWVRNRRDGTVEAEVHGDRAAVEALAERLRKGPSGTGVSAVDVDWLPDAGAAPGGFEIRPTV